MENILFWNVSTVLILLNQFSGFNTVAFWAVIFLIYCNTVNAHILGLPLEDWVYTLGYVNIATRRRHKVKWLLHCYCMFFSMIMYCRSQGFITWGFLLLCFGFLLLFLFFYYAIPLSEAVNPLITTLRSLNTSLT